MLRIRFHGRGGHGIKTASRILGTAAFRAGYQAQDSPVYGAERRGAAISAFTRIDQAPILERGLIDQPDLIIIGDETLLEDAATSVLVGQHAASAVFVNAEDVTSLVDKYGIKPPAIGMDVTELTLRVLGKASALSAGLGAAAARLVGLVSEEHLVAGVREELAHLELPSELIERNVCIARQIYAALQPVEFCRPGTVTQGKIHMVGLDDSLLGTPSIFAAGNAIARHTGSWRLERPEIVHDRCTRCGICFVRCPDGAIGLDDEGYPIIDYDHCKGCMICLEQCPVSGITKRKEVRSW